MEGAFLPRLKYVARFAHNSGVSRAFRMNDDIITEVMDLSRNNCNDLAALEEMDEILQQHYGLTYLEYATIRNQLLIEHNYELPMSILQSAIINRITIKLVTDGMLEVDDNLTLKISDKGIRALHS